MECPHIKIPLRKSISTILEGAFNKKGVFMVMRHLKVFLIIAVFVCFGLASCKSTSGPSEADNVSQPQAGEWTATTTFGSFDFVVNGAGTYITSLTLNFSDWQGLSGSVTVSKDPGWSITNGNFYIDTEVMGDDWTIEGTFSNTGTSASGTWEAVRGGQTYSGSWTAYPVN